MRFFKISAFVFLISIGFSTTSKSQILISLLLGDKLNSDKIEFGITGGLNQFELRELSSSSPYHSFNLGFYFDFYLKEHLYLYTGVLVKSRMGAIKIPIYDVNNDDINGAFENGSVRRSIDYFNVPIFMKYRFDNHVYLVGGVQLGLMYNATDEFMDEYNGNPLSYKVNVKNSITRLDAGVSAGLGYKLLKGEGMNLGVRYYYGLVDVLKSDDETGYNSGLYLFAEIPIGTNKKK